MALVVADRVKETTTTTGTGTLTLAGAATGFQSFAVIGNGNTTYYTITDSATGAWEVGIGTYTASGTTLARTTVLSSSNGNALVPFGAGSKDVFVTYPAEYASTEQVGDVKIATSAPTGPGTWLETGKYYSKAAYPALASVVGNVPDLGSVASEPQAKLALGFGTNSTAGLSYNTATDGTTTVVVGSTGGIRKTTDGTNWTAAASTTSSLLNAVIYANSNFVAVGVNGTIVTSLDGTNWVLRSPQTTQTLNSVAFGNTRYVAVGASGAIAYSTDLVNWTLATGTGTQNFNKIVYANSLFVAVGAAGSVYTSTDGITWTNRTFQTTAFNDVTYGNSVFVATTSLGTPYYSTDGISWGSNYLTFAAAASSGGYGYKNATDGTTALVVGTSGAIRITTNGTNWSPVNSNTTQNLNAVRYINSNFVAVGNSGTLTTSADGLNWTQRTTLTTAVLTSVAFGNTRYVAVGASGVITYSTNLSTWVTATGTGANSFNKVIYANSLFVAVGNTGACYTSPDGITWTSRSAGSLTFNDVIYANSLFVAVGSSGNCYTSPDGLTWTSRTVAVANYTQVIYENSLFVAVGFTGAITTSSDGITWTTRTSGTTRNLNSIGWNGSSYFAVGENGVYCTSSDGVTWVVNIDVSVSAFYAVAVISSKTIAFGANTSVILAGASRSVVLFLGDWAYGINTSRVAAESIAYNGSNQYVAVGSSGVILTSSDAQTWVPRVSNIATNLTGVQYVNGNYIALGQGGAIGTRITTSSDGVTWTVASFVTTSSMFKVAYGASVYVLVGDSGFIRSSSDLVTWTSRSAGANNLNDLIFANSIFVAVGASNSVYSSTDGITWTLRTATGTWNRIIYDNGLFVIIGNGGAIATSSDGITWTTRTSNVIGDLFDIVWNGSIYCAVGDGGSITTSPDGVTWTARAAPNFSNNSISWSGSTFIVTNFSNSNILVSANGIVWTSYPTQFGGTFVSSAYLNAGFVALGSGKIATSNDGINWTAANPVQFSAIPGMSAAYTVTYSNSTFIMSGLAGSTANIATSTDGINWTGRFVGNFPTSTAQAWHYALWNGSAYYLVGANGRYATSSDAATWTVTQDVSAAPFFSVAAVNSRTIAFGVNSSVILAGATRAEVLQGGTWAYTVAAQNAANPRTIAYNGSNQYVVVGSNGVFLSSSDGQSWTGRYSGVTTNFDKVQYINSNYIAMGGTGLNANLLTSADGVTWTSRIAGTAIFNAAAFGASVYVVVGASGAVFSSPDLVTWTSRSAGAQAFRDVIFANSIFVAVGASNAVYSSTDGITWTLRTATGTWNRIIYANGLFVIVGDSSAIATSVDGITWTIRTGASGNFNDIVWSGSIFCVVGGNGSIATSPDGITWTSRSPGENTSTLLSVSWSGTRFVVTNSSNGVAWVSTDGITWTRVSTVFRGTTLDSTYLGGKFLAVGPNYLQTSTDGINWKNCDHVQYAPNSINKLYKLGSYYYAATNAGLFQSSDGITFSLASREIVMGAILSLAYSGSAWVAVTTGASGQPATVYKSTDGTTWAKSADIGTLTINTSTAALQDVVYGGSNFVLGMSLSGNQNVPTGIQTSSDGVTWTARALPYNAAVTGAMASDGSTIVVGTLNPGVNAKSTDGGVTWSMLISGGGGNNIYSNGIWVIAASTVSGFLTSDLINYVQVTAPVANGIYVYNGAFVLTAASTASRVLASPKSAAASTYLINNNGALYSAANASKEYPVRGTTLLVPGNVVAISNSFAPYLISEVGLYGYDTATTFWVPPQQAGSGQTAYIYAGA